MGTRNLTAVMVDGVYKIAQYGQWDGYPEGQGKTALAFAKEHLSTPEGRAAFKRACMRVRFVTDPAEYDSMNEAAGVKPRGGMITLAESDRLNRMFPFFDRDHGAKILGMVLGSTGEVRMKNSIDFAGDSLFCEWAYVIDLDKLTLEVFKGFNMKPVPIGERFAEAKYEPSSDERTYFPVRLVESFSLDALPSNKEFVFAANRLDREEGEE